MKTLKFSLLLAVLVLAKSQSLDKMDWVAFEAIKGVLEHHFAVHQPKVDLYFCGPTSAVLANKLLREKPVEVSIRVIDIDNVDMLHIDVPSIVLFDSGEHFNRSDHKLAILGKYGARQNSLVYAPKKGEIDVIAHLSEINFAYENENYIRVVNDSTVDLVTGFYYSHDVCKSTRYKTIN
jgi:hypothetical protein